MPLGGEVCACDATVTLHAGGTARGAGRPLSGFGSGLAIFPRSVRTHRVNANICRRLAILPRLLGPTCMALGHVPPFVCHPAQHLIIPLPLEAALGLLTQASPPRCERKSEGRPWARAAEAAALLCDTEPDPGRGGGRGPIRSLAAGTHDSWRGHHVTSDCSLA